MRRSPQVGATDSTGPLCNQDAAVAYENPEVVARFCAAYDVDVREAEDIFKETCRWLWLVATRQQDPGPECEGLVITASLYILDEMWHTFLLFTRDYMNFCEGHLGQYVHHQPASESGEAALSGVAREARLRRQMSYIYDHLGSDTLVKWYSDYVDRYPPEVIERLRK